MQCQQERVRTPASFSAGIGPIWSRLTQSALSKADLAHIRIVDWAAYRCIRFSFALRESIVSWREGWCYLHACRFIVLVAGSGDGCLSIRLKKSST